jgi:hypothetical protein
VPLPLGQHGAAGLAATTAGRPLHELQYDERYDDEWVQPALAKKQQARPRVMSRIMDLSPGGAARLATTW